MARVNLTFVLSVNSTFSFPLVPTALCHSVRVHLSLFIASCPTSTMTRVIHGCFLDTLHKNTYVIY